MASNSQFVKAYSGVSHVNVDEIGSIRVDGAGSQWAVYADGRNGAASFNGNGSVQISSSWSSTQAAAQAKADVFAQRFGVVDLG